jgi:hypothetical protein
MNIKWTPEKIEELKSLISKKTSPRDMANIMGFTKSAVTTKCGELRLSFNYDGKVINWNEDNIKKLIELNNQKKTHPEIAKFFGCNVVAIHGKLSQLKIKSKNVNYFTEEEKQKLINLFNEGRSINYISKILNRGAPYLYTLAKNLGLISKKSKLIQEQLSLKKEGKRRCNNCKEIYPYDTEHFNSNRGICKFCSKKSGKIRYQSLMNNLTTEKLLKIRCEQAYQRACKKGWEFDITPEYLLEIYNKQNGNCYYSGIKMEISLKGYTNNNYVLSVDRKNSNEGYIKNNIVLCCDSVNTMKMKLETNEFLNICKKIIDHQIASVNDNSHIIGDIAH